MSNVRLGIIGAGYIAQEHLKVIQAMAGVCAVGITSRTKSKAEELARKYDVEEVFENVDKIFSVVSIEGLFSTQSKRT